VIVLLWLVDGGLLLSGLLVALIVVCVAVGVFRTVRAHAATRRAVLAALSAAQAERDRQSTEQDRVDAEFNKIVARYEGTDL
jgi:cell division protein FtsL